MIGLDTNLLFAAIEKHHENHSGARGFLESLQTRDDIAVSEFVLVELYGLLRNPVTVRKPLGAASAVRACQAFRTHPHWRLLGFPPDSPIVHNQLWKIAASQGFARRRIYDMRLGLSLIHQGVTDFATVNVKDFDGVGFARVWNPLTGGH